MPPFATRSRFFYFTTPIVPTVSGRVVEDSRLRYRLVDFQVKQATAAVQIAAGPNPKINAVEIVVLASLTRASVANNLLGVADFDIRTVERADGERAVERKFHVACAARFLARSGNLLG
jgi:hypothetical protein